MKIAISATGPDLKSLSESRFGRAKSFLLYDLETDTYSILENEQNYALPQGAGVQTARHLIQSKVKVVISGHVGPKALETLKAGKVKIYLTSPRTISEILEDYKQDLLEEI